LILGGVLLFFSGLYWLEESRKPKDAEPFFETKSGDQTVEAKVKEITSKFICSCGTCGEQSLDICTCNTAIQERQFIRNALKSGQPLDRIFAAVNTTFGWMKPEFVVQYDSLARQPRASLRVKRGSANKIIGSSTNTE
jgi:cytochrome c-type biogenesis protein CcmH/NrfF